MTQDKLAQLSREELIAQVLRLQEQIGMLVQQVREIAVLRERVLELEAELGGRKPRRGKSRPDWVKPNVARSSGERKPRKKRPHGFARKRQEPTRRVQHAASECPRCGCALRGGWVKRRRQVLHIPVVRVEVVEHEIIARDCPQCGERVVPKVDLSSEVIGQHRVSIDTMSLIATLREVGRVPFETIQWFLDAAHGLALSLGELVAIVDTVRQRGKASLERLKERVRASPVVNADETGWREEGRNGYIWTFSTPEVRYFEYRQSRSGKVVNEILGEDFEGCLVSDFYAGYNRMAGRHQRCWTHLLRDVHDLRAEYPEDVSLQRWAQRINALYRRAKRFHSSDSRAREQAQHRYERLLSNICQRYLKQDVPQRTLCERIERYLPELFVFVADPRVPADNNAAERSLRPLVISRKISGGTRSSQGSATKMALASLFGTWRVQALNPFESCRNLLLSPQP